MIGHSFLCRMKPYIQPFEHLLALRELRSLSGVAPEPEGRDHSDALLFRISSAVAPDFLAERLAYWEAVLADREVLTRQVRFEASASSPKRGQRLRERTLPNRRCLRYSVHGIHEYRGKFFPQLVRALLNDGDVPERGLVVDPMCGSGTTIVEAAVSGRNSVGVDLNPLSVLITEAKCALLRVASETIEAAAYDAHANAALARGDAQKLTWFSSLPAEDQLYLRRWLSPGALHGLEIVTLAARRVRTRAIRALHLVTVSNIIRWASHQKEDDLRVRREEREVSADEVVERWATEVHKASQLVASFLKEADTCRFGKTRVLEGDARLTRAAAGIRDESVDAVVTSPPYATALPYLDTDRLSLCWLKLLPRPEHRRRDLLMIGNREVTERRRAELLAAFERRSRDLPTSTVALVRQIQRLNARSAVGFRRRNLGALLGAYFLDMHTVLGEISAMLRPGAAAYIVVGNNRTVAGGVDIEIETATHLASIARQRGLQVVDRIEMEMLTSRDIFRKNAMPSEQIIVLRKPNRAAAAFQ